MWRKEDREMNSAQRCFPHSAVKYSFPNAEYQTINGLDIFPPDIGMWMDLSGLQVISKVIDNITSKSLPNINSFARCFKFHKYTKCANIALQWCISARAGIHCCSTCSTTGVIVDRNFWVTVCHRTPKCQRVCLH